MSMAGGHAHPDGRCYKLEPPIADRMALEPSPREHTAQSYLATRAAHRTLSLLTERYDRGLGELFWLTDPSGTGKTHFLNYFIALRHELAKARNHGRELVVALDYPAPGSAAQLLNDLVAAMARELGGSDRRATPLWRRIGADAAFEVAVGQARRAGIHTITTVIDCGPNPAPSHSAGLAAIARASRRPNLIAIGAGAGHPANAVMVEIAPASAQERLAIAVGRARRLEPRWAAMAHLYRAIDLAPFTAEEIFPFHPQTLRLLGAMDETNPSIAGLTRTVREVLAAAGGAAALIYPCGLFDVPEIRRIIGQRLGTDGRAAMRTAEAAAQEMARRNRHLARAIVRTLILAHLYDRDPGLEIDQLWSRLPADAAQRNSGILEELAAASNGAISVWSGGAAFVPARSSGPDCEEFNRALPLLRLFDAGLETVTSAAELGAAMARLELSLSNLIEETQQVAQALHRFAAASNAPDQPGPEVTRAIDAIVQIAQGGARGLVKSAGEHKAAAAVQALAAEYHEIAAAAASVPALLAIRDYLEQTRLEADSIDRRQTPEIAALAAERRLLEAELGPRAPYARTRDSLLARFESFKWSYVEHYRAAHERWREEMKKASLLAHDARRYLQALRRLDSIAALGPPLSGGCEPARVDGAGFKVCGIDGQFNAYAAAVCPQCNYRLGTASPMPELDRSLDQIRRALSEKLTALSRGAIARLIKKYDRAHRLDGFLKITQAAQTEALAAVLDDDLTAYIARLLETSEIAPARRRPASSGQERG